MATAEGISRHDGNHSAGPAAALAVHGLAPARRRGSCPRYPAPPPRAFSLACFLSDLTEKQVLLPNNANFKKLNIWKPLVLGITTPIVPFKIRMHSLLTTGMKWPPFHRSV